MLCCSTKEVCKEEKKLMTELIVSKKAKDVVLFLHDTVSSYYADDHAFKKDYLSSFISVENQQLVNDT